MNIMQQINLLEHDIDYCKQFIPLISENPEEYEGFLFKLEELEDEYLKLCLHYNIEPKLETFML